MSDAHAGAWYVYTDEDGDAIAVAQHSVGPKGGWMGIQVAKMPVPSEHKTREQINANARLIAAAPELLEALKVAQLWLDVDGRFDMQGINAAIAKAEGRT